ncbi:hypothetical protein ESY86_10955 [Subsaximicrobium wynnwilliamsii]|uniref:Uncharacterized protein n=1 Tax=Subsaximicrobium wynnwilliamsii TaxID=291179 RepID=A0A5C6ZIJ3_9FLAO|nr:DUF5995 family protein [Subsaximicrobium wynnwilliamsii]TXD84042.1 hypothetical protein ESY87_05885 [Subsaximicrobium wynnwilliamsii]TXD89000.1 hypothetical protein ESY86_10955 [Subsaximicrobium wynnwilliamsii]TXE03754.1 hypothetical protein ESY88_05880 [Subsaximicrobium wynnwilliamsii]
MPGATTIKNVIEELDAIINESIKTNSRMGLFAYIYKRTTAEVAAEIALGHFKDNQNLERLDVAFANLYLDAYRDYKSHQQVSASWAFAFDQVHEPLTIVQHIMLGMNVHINLDLAVATANTMSGREILDIEEDFNKVNDILLQITNELQDRLSRVSPLMFILDVLGENKDEKIIDFSMRKARGQSWNASNLLWSLGENKSGQAINSIDQLVLKLGKCIKTPKTRTVRFFLRVIQKFETKQVGSIISKLRAD